MGIIEHCHGPFWNPWYPVKNNTPGKYWLVKLVIKLNGTIIWEANLLPSADEFFEEFAGCAFVSPINFFSGYDLVDFDKESRYLTRFQTPLGLI